MTFDVATINWPIWQLIVVIVGVFFVGSLLGFYSFSSESKKKIRDATERADIAVQQAKGEIERAAARIAQAEPPPVSALPGKSLLRLWLDERERPGLDLDGQQVDTVPLSDHNRKRLIALVTVMRPWIEGKPGASMPAPSVPVPAPAPAPKPASATITYTPTPPPAAPVEMPSLSKSLANSVSNILTVKKEEKPAAPLTIVGQIDEILQARLAGSPLESRGIKLVESPEGGVIVMVGEQKFAGVGEVTEPQIQAELRAAIAAWEKKYTPGM